MPRLSFLSSYWRILVDYILPLANWSTNYRLNKILLIIRKYYSLHPDYPYNHSVDFQIHSLNLAIHYISSCILFEAEWNKAADDRFEELYSIQKRIDYDVGIVHGVKRPQERAEVSPLIILFAKYSLLPFQIISLHL